MNERYSYSDVELASAWTRKIVSENKDLNAIAAFNVISSIGVAQEIDRLGQIYTLTKVTDKETMFREDNRKLNFTFVD